MASVSALEASRVTSCKSSPDRASPTLEHVSLHIYINMYTVFSNISDSSYALACIPALLARLISRVLQADSKIDVWALEAFLFFVAFDRDMRYRRILDMSPSRVAVDLLLLPSIC